MRYFYPILICCFMVIQQTSATCTYPPMTLLNETALTGNTWYVVGIQGSTTETCRKYNFIAGLNNAINYQYTNATGKQSTTTDGKLTPFLISPYLSGFNEYFPANASTAQLFKVVDINYTNYAVTYRCISSTDTYEFWSSDPNGFAATKASLGSKVPTTITLNPLSNNCPTGTLKDIFKFLG